MFLVYNALVVNAKKCEVAETLIAVVMSGRVDSGNSHRAAKLIGKQKEE